MSRHVLLIALGPVQEFIAQARRTRDLWFGSHVLSELGRAAGASLAHAGAQMIFPALEKGDPELQPCDEMVREDGSPPISISNRILSEVPDGSQPAALAKAAREAALQRWRSIASDVYRRRERLLAPNVQDVWSEQIDDVIEFYAAWAPIEDDTAESYRNARHAVEDALAGRKLLRDFDAWRHDRAGAPKSSLDGARVSVLRDEREGVPGFAELRIGTGEQLDAVGLVKRGGGRPEQFVPLLNIAAADWLRRGACHAHTALNAVAGAAGNLDCPLRIGRDLPAVQPFRFDAGLLYRNRIPVLFEELGEESWELAAKRWVEEVAEPVWEQIGAPPAYVACVVADGDRMGETLDKLDSPSRHRDFSKALAAFPRAARTVVEDEHLGSLVYAGGDDVLAFLPVPTAFRCAEELNAKFHEALKSAVGSPPTLSVGIGIGHALDGMGELLELGRKAERAAKTHGRNALAVLVDKRSGGQRIWAGSWADDPVGRLTRDAELLLGDRLPTGKIHETGALLRRLPQPVGTPDRLPSDALRSYAVGILRQSGSRNRSIPIDELELVPPGGASYAEAHRFITRAVDRLLIAKALVDADFGRESAQEKAAV